MQLLWLVLSTILALAALPLFAELLLCSVGNLLPRFSRRRQGGSALQLAVVVPAHNEERLVGRLVASVRAASPAVTLYVVAHNCADQTAARAAEAGATVLILDDAAQRGKGAALRHGFARAFADGAEAVLVVDADSVVSQNLIEATGAALAAGASATQCRYELALPPGRNRLSARLRLLAFRGMNVQRARGRAHLGFSAGLFGNGFALTRQTLTQVPFAVDSIVEDLEYHTRLVEAGLRVEFVREATVWAEVAAPGTAQATQEARWEGGRLNVAGRRLGPLLGAAFGGRWRALEALADVSSLPLSRGFVLLLLLALIPVPLAHTLALAGMTISLVYLLESLCLGNDPVRELAALSAAPFYLVWKLAATPLVLRQAGNRAAWVRTDREESGE